jgi:hypothetical protein
MISGGRCLVRGRVTVPGEFLELRTHEFRSLLATQNRSNLLNRCGSGKWTAMKHVERKYISYYDITIRQRLRQNDEDNSVVRLIDGH